jgi:hypothetical protein
MMMMMMNERGNDKNKIEIKKKKNERTIYL